MEYIGREKQIVLRVRVQIGRSKGDVIVVNILPVTAVLEMRTFSICDFSACHVPHTKQIASNLLPILNTTCAILLTFFLFSSHLTMTFSFSIFSVLIAIILAYIPHIIRVVILRKAHAYDNTHPRISAFPSLSPARRELVTRLSSAHANQLETLAMYASGILAAHLAMVPTSTINFWAAVFIIARIAYVIAYISPQIADGNFRTLAFVFCLTAICSLWNAAAKGNGIDARQIMRGKVGEW